MVGKVASRTILVERLDPLRVVTAAKLDHPYDLLGLIDKEGIRQLFASPGVGQQIFAPPGRRPLRSDLPETQSHGGDTQVVCRLHGVL